MGSGKSPCPVQKSWFQSVLSNVCFMSTDIGGCPGISYVTRNQCWSLYWCCKLEMCHVLGGVKGIVALV